MEPACSCLVRIKIFCGVIREPKQYGNLELSTVMTKDHSIIMPVSIPFTGAIQSIDTHLINNLRITMVKEKRKSMADI
jgi:hypothetical protein